MIHLVLLVLCAVVIYLACEWFVNAVEWLGQQLNVGQVVVGTILAAVGTALPESVVTLVAVTFDGGEHGAEIGMGAAMGGPLVVGTIAYAVVGTTLLLTTRHRHRRHIQAQRSGTTPGLDEGSGADPASYQADPAGHETARGGGLSGVGTSRLARDQTWFLVIFAVKVGLGLAMFSVKPWLGVVFCTAYAPCFCGEGCAVTTPRPPTSWNR